MRSRRRCRCQTDGASRDSDGPAATSNWGTGGLSAAGSGGCAGFLRACCAPRIVRVQGVFDRPKDRVRSRCARHARRDAAGRRDPRRGAPGHASAPRTGPCRRVERPLRRVVRADEPHVRWEHNPLDYLGIDRASARADRDGSRSPATAAATSPSAASRAPATATGCRTWPRSRTSCST